MHTTTSQPEPSTEGARLLREYLTLTGQSVQGFCKKHELDRIQVLRVLKGKYGKRVSVDFAEAIERATSGAVPWRAWLQPKAETTEPAKVAA